MKDQSDRVKRFATYCTCKMAVVGACSKMAVVGACGKMAVVGACGKMAVVACVVEACGMYGGGMYAAV